MKFRVFYYLHNSPEDEVTAEQGVEMEHADIYTELFGGLEVHNDFFGMVDAQGAILQVMYHEEKDSYWFEIPVESEGGSYGRFIDFDEAVDFIKRLPSTFEVARFPSFEFEPWVGDEIVDDDKSDTEQ